MEVKMEQKNHWQISYPKGMIKYIDFFRDELFQYKIYDQVVKKYIDQYSKISVKNLCSLGCGTGRHEVELKQMGYNIIGVERNSESFPVVESMFDSRGVERIKMVEADFFDESILKQKFDPQQFDCILLLFVPLSIEDTVKLVDIFANYLKPGGLFVTNQFLGYEEGFVPNVTLCDNDYAENPFQKDLPYQEREFCVRLNTFKYLDNIIDWTSVYIFNDENGQVRMARDHDIIDVLFKDTYMTRLKPKSENMEILPLYEVSEIRGEANMPKTTDCIVAWRKNESTIIY